MLAFDDAALARLAIAASSIAPHRRGRWLRRVAREVEDRARKRDGARRVRESTQRARAGRRKVWVEIGPDDEDTLMAAGVLREWDLDDRKALGKAIEGLLALLRSKSGHNALATCLRDWVIIRDMTIAKQVRRLKQSIEADCMPADREALSRAQRTSVSGLSLADLAAATGDVIKEQRREILEHVQRLLTLVEVRLSDPREKMRLDRIARRVTQIEAELRMGRKNRDG